MDLLTLALHHIFFVLITRARYSQLQEYSPIWGPSVGDELLQRPVNCSVRLKGCRKIELVSFIGAAWPEEMQSAHARGMLQALRWQLM